MGELPPIVKATLQASTINAFANIVAQGITAYKTETPFQIDYTALIEFTTVAIINTPIGYLWMTNLESTFPAYDEQPKSEKIKEKEQEQETAPQQKLNIKNTILKVALDQTIGGATMTILFLTTIALLRGAGSEEILESIYNETLPLFIAGLKVWPMVSFLSFSVIPVDQRVLFGSAVGFGWAIYMSLITAA